MCSCQFTCFRWNDVYLKNNNIKNARNQQARLKTVNKNLKKAKKMENTKFTKKENPGFGEKFNRDRFEL